MTTTPDNAPADGEKRTGIRKGDMGGTLSPEQSAAVARIATEPIVEKRLREALDAVTAALRAQLYDLHERCTRPCSTCSASSKALTVADVVRVWHNDKRAGATGKRGES